MRLVAAYLLWPCKHAPSRIRRGAEERSLINCETERTLCAWRPLSIAMVIWDGHVGGYVRVGALYEVGEA